MRMKGVTFVAIYLADIKDCKKKGTSLRTYTLYVPEGMHWTGGAHMRVALYEGLSPELAQKIKQADKETRCALLAGITEADFDPAFTRTFSISTRECDNAIVFSTRIAAEPSLFKKTLGEYQVGDGIFILTSATHLHVPPKGPIVALTMGVGLSSLHAFIRDLLEAGGDGPILSLNVAEPLEELTELEVHDERVRYMYKNNRYSFEQAVKKLMEDRVLVEQGRFIVIGGHRFMKEWIAFLADNGVAQDRIFLDRPDEQRAIYIK